MELFKYDNKRFLLITGENILYIINVNQHNLIRKINVPDSYYINASCLLNKNIILTGDSMKQLKQWRIERDNLKLISTKKNAHDKGVYVLIKLADGHILSGSYDDGVVKIW